MGSKQPKLILRESCVDDLSLNWTPGRFLETGAGSGYMTKRFLDRGFTGACYDLGEESRSRIRNNLSSYGPRVMVCDDFKILSPDSFDYLISFEVLEHIENDLGALNEWTKYLKPGGQIMLTVPAHPRKFGRSDEVVGHVRRYERVQLRELMMKAGYRDIRIINYGFPLTEVTRPISNLLLIREKEHVSLTDVERSTRSSFSRPRRIRAILNFFDDRIVLPFRHIQRWFYEMDLGDGLAAVAIKAESDK